MRTSQDIEEMIGCFKLDATESPDQIASRLLDILLALNERMDCTDSKLTRVSNTLANHLDESSSQ